MTTSPTRPPCIRGCCTEERIAIDAPVADVWRILADFAEWHAWNPLYIETAGRMQVGETLEFAVKLGGMKPIASHAEVLAVEPDKLIEYAVGGPRAPIRVLRYIELSSTGSHSCRVANGEIMGGPLGKVMARVLRARLRRGLAGMNDALKAGAEGAASGSLRVLTPAAKLLI